MNNPVTKHVMEFKCIKCGEKNKLICNLLTINKKHYGIITKCCGCGFIETYLDEESDLSWLYTGKLRIGMGECSKKNMCNNTKCPLYESYISKRENNILQLNQDDKKSILPELSINVINKNDKFK